MGRQPVCLEIGILRATKKAILDYLAGTGEVDQENIATHLDGLGIPTSSLTYHLLGLRTYNGGHITCRREGHRLLYRLNKPFEPEPPPPDPKPAVKLTGVLFRAKGSVYRVAGRRNPSQWWAISGPWPRHPFEAAFILENALFDPCCPSCSMADALFPPDGNRHYCRRCAAPFFWICPPNSVDER